jgi:death-on-curing protein
MNEPEWLTKDDILVIHEEAIGLFGGSQGIRDEALLESAIMRPQNVFAYENGSIFELAATYAEGIAHNHPFIDGNKRTGLGAVGLFLVLNGYALKVQNQKDLSDMMVDLAEHKVERADVAEFFEKNCEPIVDPLFPAG